MLSSNIFRFLDEPIYGSYCVPDVYQLNYPRRKNVWSTSIPVAGYEPSEVAIKEDKNDKGEVKIVIHAKHEKDDDFSEFRKSVQIPKNVDHENLRTIMSKDGVLILKAPYKDSTSSNVQPMKLHREDTWNGIWGELSRLNEQMNQIVDVHGISNRNHSEFVPNETGEGGTWRLKLNVGKDFKPEEIKLRNHNNQIHLEAKREKKDDNSWSSRYFNEVISIPQEIEADKLRSKLLDNGELIVEAPCKKMPSIANVNDVGQNIPIDVHKSAAEGDTKMAVDN